MATGHTARKTMTLLQYKLPGRAISHFKDQLAAKMLQLNLFVVFSLEFFEK